MDMCHHWKERVRMETVETWKQNEKSNVVETLLAKPYHLFLASISVIFVNNLGIETKIF